MLDSSWPRISRGFEPWMPFFGFPGIKATNRVPRIDLPVAWLLPFQNGGRKEHLQQLFNHVLFQTVDEILEPL